MAKAKTKKTENEQVWVPLPESGSKKYNELKKAWEDAKKANKETFDAMMAAQDALSDYYTEAAREQEKIKQSEYIKISKYGQFTPAPVSEKKGQAKKKPEGLGIKV